jgi:hypothetical protein
LSQLSVSTQEQPRKAFGVRGGLSAGSWRPGQSGNPNGRAKPEVDIAALARKHGPRCIEVAARLLASKDEKMRLAAAVALLDRGWGRPAQAITGENGQPLQIDFRWADSVPTVTITQVRQTIEATATDLESD